jgi:hypothetical protein
MKSIFPLETHGYHALPVSFFLTVFSSESPLFLALICPNHCMLMWPLPIQQTHVLLCYSSLDGLT